MNTLTDSYTVYRDEVPVLKGKNNFQGGIGQPQSLQTIIPRKG